jgi:hypothetical protein
MKVTNQFLLQMSHVSFFVYFHDQQGLDWHLIPSESLYRLVLNNTFNSGLCNLSDFCLASEQS